jgi:hypothetical protein
MRVRALGFALTLLAATAAAYPSAQNPPAPVTARRLAQNPLVTVESSPSLGDNVNGPSIIRVPEWVDQPLGRYYMYFAHHMGAFIRLAYADRIEGPWRIHEPGVLPVASTAFYRLQPDPPENLENFYTHVASPEVYVDHTNRRLVMWFHGWFTEGQRWPAGEPAARAWAQKNGYGQYTQVAESRDGLLFAVRPAITRTSYLRVFARGAATGCLVPGAACAQGCLVPGATCLYGMARLGLMLRSSDPLAHFEPGPNPFAGGPYAGRVRHVALLQRGTVLNVFFTAIGDDPERVMMTTIDASGDWTAWQTTEAVELLRPEAPYECPNLPAGPSAAGDVKGPVRQMRDPAVFEEDGRTWLFYSICGEQGIAAAELELRN